MRIALGVGVSAVIALVALYADGLVPLPDGGFVPGSFVTHSVMLALALAVMRLVPGSALADFGFTVGDYRFRPSILLWILPTGVLTTLSTLAPGSGAGSQELEGRAVLQTVVFIWFYSSFCEEVLTRGLLQTMVTVDEERGHSGTWFTMPAVISGLFFGVMHIVLVSSMGAAAAPAIVLAAVLGFVAAHYREASGSLIPAFIVHFLFNVGGMLPLWITRLMAA
jgi:membrane protease YdiL (CAAX protease family)